MEIASEDASPTAIKKQKSAKASKSDGSAKASTKKSKKELAAETEETVPVEDEASDIEPGTELQALAKGIDSDDEDPQPSKESEFKPGQEVGKVPKISKKLQKEAKSESTGGRGVIYVGRIPFGFFEHEMRQYFTQFGIITRLRMARNKWTGASKHYAFIEFEEKEVAEIVAKTMDNYLLFGHILKCKVVPDEQIHETMWKGANRRFKVRPWSKIIGGKLAQPRTESAWAEKKTKEARKRASLAEKLKELDYEYEAPELKDTPAPIQQQEDGHIENSESKAIEAPTKGDRKPKKVTSIEEAPNAVVEIGEKEETAKANGVEEKTKKGAKQKRKSKA
jgi:nucleolar protein 15